MLEQDEDFKNIVKEEFQALKAPAELISHTKEAAAREEVRTAVRRKRRIRYFTGGSALVVAAALVLWISPLALNRQEASQQEGVQSEEYETQDAEKQSAADSSGTWLRLGSIDGGQEIYLEEEVSIDRAKILPMAFQQSEDTETIGDVTVRYAKNSDGLWMAAFEERGVYVIITAQVTDVQEMRTIITKVLQEL